MHDGWLAATVRLVRVVYNIGILRIPILLVHIKLAIYKLARHHKTHSIEADLCAWGWVEACPGLWSR